MFRQYQPFSDGKSSGAMEVSQSRIGPAGQAGQEGGPSETQAMPRSLLEARRVVVQVQDGFSFFVIEPPPSLLR
jgi:hypothetical protein